MNCYGHFDDASREYVITRPDTPWPWINYMGTGDFFSLISNTAGGYCFWAIGSGIRAGSLARRRWTFMNAAMEWAIPAFVGRKEAFVPKRFSLSRWNSDARYIG